MSIVEQRDYHVFTGRLSELVRLYADEGIAIQEETSGATTASPSASNAVRSCRPTSAGNGFSRRSSR